MLSFIDYFFLKMVGFLGTTAKTVGIIYQKIICCTGANFWSPNVLFNPQAGQAQGIAPTIPIFLLRTTTFNY